MYDDMERLHRPFESYFIGEMFGRGGCEFLQRDKASPEIRTADINLNKTCAMEMEKGDVREPQGKDKQRIECQQEYEKSSKAVGHLR
jgi:hypothetical protein